MEALAYLYLKNAKITFPLELPYMYIPKYQELHVHIYSVVDH